MVFMYGIYLFVLLICGSPPRLHSLKQDDLNLIIVDDDDFLRETIDKTVFTGYSVPKNIRRFNVLEESNVIKSIIDEQNAADKTFLILLKSDYESISKRIYNSPLCYARGTIQSNNFVFCGQKTNQTLLTALTNNVIEKKLTPKQKNDYVKNNIITYSYQSFFAYAIEEEEKAIASKKEKERCKYRKTCYNNNDYVVPLEKSKPIKKDYKNEKIVNKETSKEELRLMCKYRLSCYDNNDLNEKIFNEKEKKQQTATILTSKPSATVSSIEKPTTVKELVNTVIKELEQKERNKPEKPKISNSEDLLTTVKKEEKSKNNCKYRKSCYKTGIAPKIEQSVWLTKATNLFKLDHNNEENKKLKNFEDMSDVEQKTHCKYRKSCYKTGKLAETLPAQTFHYSEIIKREQKEVPLQMRCKYRKSCYETGNLPKDLQKEIFSEKEKEKEIAPLNTIDDLKLFCKYRKNCYVKMSKTESVDTNEETDKVDVEQDEEELKKPITKQPSKKENIKKEAKVPKAQISKPKTKQPKKIVVEDAEDVVSETKTQKEKHEEFCEKISAEDQFSSAIKNNAPIVKRIKGKQPTQQIKNEVLDEDDIIKISSRKHLKRVKKPDEIKNTNKIEEDVEDKIEIVATSPILQEEKEDDNDEEIVENEEDEDKENNEEKDSKELDADDDDDTIIKHKTENVITKINTGKKLRKEKIGEGSKLACKYRKSCYQNIDDEYYEEYDDNTKHDQLNALPVRNDFEKDWSKMRKEEQLKCKYRKSCYDDTQVLIEDEKNINEPLPKSNMKQKSGKNPHNPSPPPRNEKDLAEQINKDAKFKCKYRHSCYETIAPHIERTKPVTKPKINDNIHPSSTTKTGNISAEQISKAIKHQCKYRHSCYRIIVPEYGQQTNQEVEEQLDKIPPPNKIVGNRLLIENKYVRHLVLPNGEVCNKYKRSCQEQLNIPPKEKIPIGKNGKKLCRKKKPEGNAH